RRRHTRFSRDWSSDVCSSDLHCEIYNVRPWSYKDLPKRYAEFGTVYRYEQSGELHGLTRVRGFTQDDAHIFCTPEQLDEEFKKRSEERRVGKECRCVR